MSDAALTRVSTYAQVRIREPAGERMFGETPTIGGQGADIIVPGAAPGVAVQIERRKAAWLVQPIGRAEVRFDGQPLDTIRDLRRHDVLAVGDAQIIVTDVSRTLLRLDVCHLAGNATVPPANILTSISIESDDDLEIHARGASGERADPGAAAETPGLQSIAGQWLSRYRLPSGGLRKYRAVLAGLAAAVLVLSAVVYRLHSMALERAKLPGKLHVDTRGVTATVNVDGIDSGTAPGVLDIPAGKHTLTFHAPRYVDYIATVPIKGAGAYQNLTITLQPSWGTLQISAIPAGAHVNVDDADVGVAPIILEKPSGVRHVRISAPNLKAWESSLVLNVGEVLTVGPITLGEPDAHLSLRSTPAGAEIIADGSLRGRTPVEIDLPAGVQHEVTVNMPGYSTWTQHPFASSGKTIALNARLQPISGQVTVQGEPESAELLIDGVVRGSTPQSLELPATGHRIEVRKKGWSSYIGTVTPAPGLDRTVSYHLTFAVAPAETATTLYTQTGYALRLVPTSNEGLRPGIPRPFYMGVLKVTNEQFRRFRPNHASEPAGRRSLDLDDQPVIQISWNDAAEYCNWLSEHDSLPPAYQKRDATYVLQQPATIGYRLPTAAEWEYVASRASASGQATPTSLGLQDLSRKVSEWVNDSPLPHVQGTDTGSTTPGFRIARYAD